jgi:hypothetical protein
MKESKREANRRYQKEFRERNQENLSKIRRVYEENQVRRKLGLTLLDNIDTKGKNNAI